MNSGRRDTMRELDAALQELVITVLKETGLAALMGFVEKLLKRGRPPKSVDSRG